MRAIVPPGCGPGSVFGVADGAEDAVGAAAYAPAAGAQAASGGCVESGPAAAAVSAHGSASPAAPPASPPAPTPAAAPPARSSPEPIEVDAAAVQLRERAPSAARGDGGRAAPAEAKVAASAWLSDTMGEAIDAD